jgi:simple sugar transport system permease protein
MTKVQNIAQVKADERMRRDSAVKRLLRRPELGAIGGAVLVWILFAFFAGNRGFLMLSGTATYLEVGAQLGILAIAVSLLMIGGEFDLSIGSVIGGAGMTIAILSAQFGWPMWAAIIASLVLSLLVGLINGLMVVRTRLPSFIITLGSLFVVRGLTIGLTRLITGRTQVGGIKDAIGYDLAYKLFAYDYEIVDASRMTRAGMPPVTADFPVSIVWFVLLGALATYVLLRTRPGNWIFGVGGDANAARNVGVPVGKVKIALFMLTAASAWLVATIQVISVGSADALRGEQREFFAIIAAVIGGTLLTGGYGSAIGAMFGAIIIGIVQQGIVFAGVDSDWFLVVMGALLIIAVLVNNYIRKSASEAK